jgi:hypothetical protein
VSDDFSTIYNRIPIGLWEIIGSAQPRNNVPVEHLVQHGEIFNCMGCGSADANSR